MSAVREWASGEGHDREEGDLVREMAGYALCMGRLPVILEGIHTLVRFVHGARTSVTEQDPPAPTPQSMTQGGGGGDNEEMQILRLRLSCAEKELELAKRTAQEELEPEDEPLVPLNKFNVG